MLFFGGGGGGGGSVPRHYNTEILRFTQRLRGVGAGEKGGRGRRWGVGGTGIQTNQEHKSHFCLNIYGCLVAFLG